MKGFLAGIIRGKLFGNSKCTNTYIVHNVHIYYLLKKLKKTVQYTNNMDISFLQMVGLVLHF